jgi:CIC family chloride channel protein
LFRVPQYELVHPLEFGIYAVLGVIGGFLSVAFTKLLLGMRKRFLLLPRSTRWWHPVVGGVLVGVMGWFVPQVLGVGYSYVGQALSGNMALKLMILLVVLKLFAITTAYASGNAGGIFGPALFLGAMLGGAIGTVAHHWLPTYTAAPGAYALVGMGALFAGIVRAPMTSVLMIFEMTRDYAVIVPLMIANLASLFISRRFQKEPIYEALAHQDGIHLPDRQLQEEVRGRTVALVMRRATKEILPGSMTVREAAEITLPGKFHAWPITDEGSVVGLVGRTEIEDALADGKAEQSLQSLWATLEFPHVHADHPLHLALERMSKSHVDVLPVVNRADVNKLEGIVTLRDVLDSYGVDSTGLA